MGKGDLMVDRASDGRWLGEGQSGRVELHERYREVAKRSLRGYWFVADNVKFLRGGEVYGRMSFYLYLRGYG